MLLSMFISLLLARKFRMKIFVPLITAVIIFISYFSVGLPSKAFTGSDYPTPSHYPLPLSFPLYSTDKTRLLGGVLFYEKYELYFLNYRIREYFHWHPLFNGINVYPYLFFLISCIST